MNSTVTGMHSMADSIFCRTKERRKEGRREGKKGEEGEGGEGEIGAAGGQTSLHSTINLHSEPL